MLHVVFNTGKKQYFQTTSILTDTKVIRENIQVDAWEIK